MPNNNFIILATPAPISHRTAEENLGLGYLTAVLREKGYNVKIIDGWLQGLTPEKLAESILSEPTPLFVGFSTYQSNMNIAVQTIKAIKKKNNNIPFIAGGFGPTFNPKDFLDAGFDIVSRGEGEETLPLIAQYYQNTGIALKDINNISYKKDNGDIQHNPLKPLNLTLDELPYPARDTMKYAISRRTPIHVLTARGCSGCCLFCSINSFFQLSKTKKYRQRSIPNIIGELKKLSELGVQHIKIIDDSFIDGNRDEKWCEEFAAAIHDNKLKFLLRGSLRADKVTDKILFYLKKAGFFSFSCGIENFSQTALKRMNKGANLEQNLAALDLFKKYHIYVQAGQILFDPETTMQELQENYHYMKQYDWIISKGIFTEMFAAEGTAFTKKVTKQHLTTSDEHSLGNYQYYIKDKKVQNAHDAMKRWHVLHMGLYDKAIDPLTSPKALSEKELKIFYNIYKKIRHKDLSIMGKILHCAENMNNQDLLDYVDLENTKNKDFFNNIAKEVRQAYKVCNLVYDAQINPFFLEGKKNVQCI